MKKMALLSVHRHVQYLDHLIAILAIETERKMEDPFITDLSDDMEKVVRYHLDSIDKALERR